MMIKFLHKIILLIVFLPASLLKVEGNNDSIPDTIAFSYFDWSNIFFNNITNNPSYTGILGGHNILINAEIDKPFLKSSNLYLPQQYNLTYDVSFGKVKNNALGFSYTNTLDGIIKNISGELTYARNINLTKNKKYYHKIRLGFSASFHKRVKNWQMTTFGDQIDPQNGFVWNSQEIPSNRTSNYLNFNSGTWYHNSFFYLGFAINNITEPDLSFYGVSKIPREFKISSGGNISINKNITLHPAFNMMIIKGFDGKLSNYSPIITGSFKNKYFLGLSYKDLNKITIHGGAVTSNSISFSVACGLSTNSDINGFGYPAYLGGNLRINIKPKK